MRLHWAFLFIIVFCVFDLLGGSQAFGQADDRLRAITHIEALDGAVGIYEKFEAVITLDVDFDNPYDPDDIRVDAEFKAPDGTTRIVPAFWYREYALYGNEANQRLQPTDDWSWRVRFAPTEAGEWEYRATASADDVTLTGEWSTFTAMESDNPGFVRIDLRNPRYFAFDNGSPYFPIGQNLAWARTGRVLADYRLWLDRMHEANANFVRIWMAPWGFALEWSDTGLGNYDLRQRNARELDVVIDMLAERDIYAMLTLINHGQFSETINAQWEDNPYNAANGGPAATPADFATSAEARRLWLQRLRYIAARWGYSPNIMTWEWWNEVEWTAISNPEILAPWIAESADYLRSIDPNQRLISHSGTPVGVESVWGQPTMDYTQDHRYTDGDISNIRRGFRNVIPEWLDAYPDKPFLMGEFGTPSMFDATGILIHQGIWAAPMLGAAGTGMTWWWDTLIHPNDLYYHFASIAAFFEGEDLGARAWQATSGSLSEDADADLYGLQADDYALLWILADDYEERYFMRQYQRNLRNRVENPLDVAFPEVSGVQVTLTDLNADDYTVEIWDAQTGEILSSATMSVTSAPLVIDLPTFSQDLAIKVKPAG